MNLPELSRLAPARLLDTRPAAEEQAFLEVEPPPGFVAAHQRPGQFCKIRVGAHEGIFAMLSPPGERPRFLVRVGNPEGGEAADALAALPSGSPIQMSLPAGRGFALERARGKDVRFVATGTGVAPVCAAIERVLAERAAYGAISLDHGLRSTRHLAIGESIARWRAEGIVTRIAYSSLGADGRVVGSTVQDTLRGACPDLAGAAIVAVGQSAMLASLRALVRELGGDPADVLTNV